MLGHIHVGGVGLRIRREITRGKQAGATQHVEMADQRIRSLEHSDFAGRLDGCVKSGITILKIALDFLMKNDIEIFHQRGLFRDESTQALAPRDVGELLIGCMHVDEVLGRTLVCAKGLAHAGAGRVPDQKHGGVVQVSFGVLDDLVHGRDVKTGGKSLLSALDVRRGEKVGVWPTAHIVQQVGFRSQRCGVGEGMIMRHVESPRRELHRGRKRTRALVVELAEALKAILLTLGIEGRASARSRPVAGHTAAGARDFATPRGWLASGPAGRAGRPGVGR